ncbi:hypothetical protein [Jatrophihabitans lederbergiae]|uniref:Uncharacterized protein n=1 Tax=Jatrophihabitans lederbergiae TaxID=3075547 RepID=A0ABU2JGE2_9ACTN|nr:hypothetical protein [Jatrophihabitans sp. DSM 44399]MDT0264044.1 hypothetical protein [Jatrophihabitans sp. DSM 44399]
MAITTSLGFFGHTVFIEMDDVFLRPGLAAHELLLRVKAQGRWLEETGKDNESYSLLSLAGRVTFGQSMTPLAEIPARVITLRGWPTSHGEGLHGRGGEPRQVSEMRAVVECHGARCPPLAPIFRVSKVI